MAPEMKSACLKNIFTNDFCPYKCGVYSLGLIIIYLTTFEDPGGLNFADIKIKKTINNIL
jgi:hypothetical protein